jgi:hypothetical protein
MKYERQQEIDCFYRGREGAGSKIRVTKDAKTMVTKEKGIVMKKRLADINIYSPNQSLDYRISVNVEEPVCEYIMDKRNVQGNFAHGDNFFSVEEPNGEPDFTRICASISHK